MWRSAARSIGACLALLCFFAVSSADPSPPSRADVTSGVRVAQRLIDTIPSPWRLDGDVRMAGDDAPVAQGNFVQASYALNKASLDSVATFSRASNAMQFDSSGYLTYAPNNLLTQSNTFSNAAWIKSNVSVSNANAVSDPFGGNTASTLTATANNGLVFQNAIYTNASTTNGVASLWIKRRTGSGAITLYRPDGSNTTVPAVTGAWTQFASTGVGGAGVFGFSIQFATSGDAVDIYNATISAVTYETTPRTADQVITTSSAYYGPRIDYDPNTLAVKGLLIEEARTNIVLQNRDLTNAAWTKGATATVAKDQTGIDGVANSASSFTGGAVSATNTVLQSITLASSTRAQSAWVKRLVGSGTVNMTTDGGATWNAITLTASWTLVQFSQTAVTNPNVGFQIITLNDKIAVDVVQNETGTFATSSIITAAASVTRAADVVQFTGAALTALQGAAHSLLVQTSDVAAFGMNLAGAGNDYQQVYLSSTGFNSRNLSGGLTVTLPSGTFASPQRVGYATNGTTRSIVASGAINTGSGGYAPVGSIYLGSYSSGAYMPNIHVTSFAVWSQRLPDATLQAKSVVGASYAANDNGIRYAFANNDNLPIHWRVAL